ELRGVARDPEPEAAVGIGTRPSPAAADGIPRFDHPVADRVATAVEQHTGELDAVGVQDLLILPDETDRVEGADCLRRGRHAPSSTGVDSRPPRPRTMSHS